MKLLKLMVILVVTMIMTGCNDEPDNDVNMPIYKHLMQSLSWDGNSTPLPPADGKAEYHIINSARELASLPEGTICEHSIMEYSSVDFSKYTLVVVTSVVYGVHVEDPAEDFVYAMANYQLTRDYQLNITYTECSLTPTWNYPDKYIMQFAFITDKLASDTPLKLVESLKSN